ncbi:MAG TPA: hypothetical protein VLM80_08645 [Anaerolineales bacterium]|nr:hypothetical protein [Anaerolineales bacterium]
MTPKHGSRPSLYIRGVVTAQKHALEIVDKGIPLNQVDAFRLQIQAVVQSVESICCKHNVRIEALPVRTYKAYLYLKSLLEQDIPQPHKNRIKKPSLTQDKTRKPLRLRGLIAFCQSVQDQFSQLCDQPDNAGTQTANQWDNLTTIKKLGIYQEILTALETLNQLIKSNKRVIVNLPPPSLRAYQWLLFLSKAENIQVHLQALSKVYAISAVSFNEENKTKKGDRLPVRFEFYHIPGLYRSQQQGYILKMVAHEGFIFAPHDMLVNLVQSLHHPQKNFHIARIRTYADSHEFIRHARQLATSGLETHSHSSGRHQNLQTIFERVNMRYFNNQVQMPQLSWSNSLTYRKYGHYQPSTDSLMLSVSLDDAKVPEYVLDFVMYHELLHKHLGFYSRNGRRISHHTEFRKQETMFPQYEQAQKYLEMLGRKVKKTKKRQKSL